MSDKPVDPNDPLEHSEYLRGLFADRANTEFIVKRDKQRKQNGDPRSAEKIWVESVREYEKRRRSERLTAWIDYHRKQAANHHANLTQLIAYHQGEVERYEAELKGAA